MLVIEERDSYEDDVGAYMINADDDVDDFRITMCSSIFLLMGTAVERYLAVCRPHHYRTVGGHHHHRRHHHGRLPQQSDAEINWDSSSDHALWCFCLVSLVESVRNRHHQHGRCHCHQIMHFYILYNCRSKTSPAVLPGTSCPASWRQSWWIYQGLANISLHFMMTWFHFGITMIIYV